MQLGNLRTLLFKTLRLFVFGVLVVFFGGCTLLVQENEVYATDEIKATPEVLAPETTPETSSNQDELVEQNCVTLSKDLSSSDIPGFVVLANYGLGDAYILDLETMRSKPVPSSIDGTYILDDFSVSPNDKQLAYVVASENYAWRLNIISANGEIITSLPWQDNWRNIVGWVGDSSLIIGQVGDPLDILLLLDIFSGDQQEITTELPSLMTLRYPALYWGQYTFSLTVFDPTFSKVVYPSRSKDLTNIIDTIVLWDVTKNKEITYWTGNVFYGQTPEWSPDGEKLLINNSLPGDTPIPGGVSKEQELFIVSKEGNIKQLTHLLNFYSTAVIGKSNWSKDSKYAAFWLKATPSDYPAPFEDITEHPLQRLAIVNVTTGKITNYCIPGDQYNSLAYPPIWSPDGNYIVAENRQDDLTSKVYLADIKNGVAYQIAEDLQPVGWMILP